MRLFIAICLFAAAGSAAADCANYSYCQFWEGACANGTRQSPIANNLNQRTRNERLEVPVLTAYRESHDVSMTNTQTTIKVKPARADAVPIKYYGDYWLEEFHFHLPAEHVIDDWEKAVKPEAELHLVHKNADKSRAVAIAVPIYLGPSNAALKALMMAGRPPLCTFKSGPAALPIGALLPGDFSKFITYEGSLTTPPCSEVVTFLLMNGGITATREEIEFLRVTMNARPVQYTRPTTKVEYRP